MKTLFAVWALAVSVQAFALELNAKIDRVFCSISGSELVRTQYMNKTKTVSFTETKVVRIVGVETLLPKVIETASDAPANMEEDYVFTMTHEGKTYQLDAKASPETQVLVRLISQSCR